MITRPLTGLATLAMIGLAPLEPALAATLEPRQLPRGGPFNLSASGLQSTPKGLLASFELVGVRPRGEFLFTVRTAPAKWFDFLAFDLGYTFVGQTGAFLPINLMPMVGFGSCFLINNFQLNLQCPIALRYAMALGPASVGVEAGYIHQVGALQMSGGSVVVDLTRWHGEVQGRLGLVSGALFYDQGAYLAGPGAKLGLNF